MSKRTSVIAKPDWLQILTRPNFAKQNLGGCSSFLATQRRKQLASFVEKIGMISDVFCKIINKELPADIVMEGENWIAINDIHPQAPVHILIVPKKHIEDISFAKEDEKELVGKLIMAANEVADKLKLDKGFRLIINQGEHGGPLVPHLHIHLLGGRHLGAKIMQDE